MQNAVSARHGLLGTLNELLHHLVVLRVVLLVRTLLFLSNCSSGGNQALVCPLTCGCFPRYITQMAKLPGIC